jgi:hypothetical protein
MREPSPRLILRKKETVAEMRRSFAVHGENICPADFNNLFINKITPLCWNRAVGKNQHHQ